MDPPDCLKAMTDRYPNRAEWITRLYEMDATFREICADHYAVTRSLAELQRGAGATESETGELHALLADVEAEIEQFLNAPPSGALR